MKLNRLIACFFGLAVWASSLPVYLGYVYMLGFPDGSVTELEAAERILAYVLIGANFAFGAAFMYLGAAGKSPAGKSSLTAAAYLIFLFVVYLIDGYFRANLANGAGG